MCQFGFICGFDFEMEVDVVLGKRLLEVFGVGVFLFFEDGVE